MILSSPFSRQHKSHQTWAPNGSQHHHQQQNGFNSLNSRKPSPRQPAPELPLANGHQHHQSPYRSHTLNRLDLLKRRQQQQQQQQRNLSSLGHYHYSPSTTTNTKKLNGCQEIYAPASIASPRELAHYKRPTGGGQHQLNGYHRQLGEQSQHYAATSCYKPGPGSESGRSGRESALGQLWERFGTLKRKAGRWSSLSSSVKSNSSSSFRNKSTTSTTTTTTTTTGDDRPNSRLSKSLLFQSTNGNKFHPPPASGPPTNNQPVQPVDPNNNQKVKLEADEIYAEGMRAIDGNAMRRLIEHEINVDLMQEGETRILIEREELQHDYRWLVRTLINWINDELADQRIIVRDLRDDLFDGQILCKLVEKLHKISLDIVEVTQNEQTQKYKLKTVLDTINRILSLQARWARQQQWTVDGIHSKNVVEMIHLLVTLALYYRAPIKLRPNVHVDVLVVQKHQGQLVSRSHQVQLTNRLDMNNNNNNNNNLPVDNREQRDAFDTLIEFAPEKLELVKEALVRFANRHLAKVNLSCSSSSSSANTATGSQRATLEPDQFSDGLLLVFLIASLEDYFVPLGNLFTSATSATNSSQHQSSSIEKSAHSLPFIDSNNNNINNQMDDQSPATPIQTALEADSFVNTQPIHKLHNVNVALHLMEEAGLEDIRQKVRAEDVANGNLKAVLRVLYALFSRYKHL